MLWENSQKTAREFIGGIRLKDKVVCEICKEQFLQISSSHLKKHGISIEEYKKLYPKVELVGGILKEKYSKRFSGNKNPMYGRKGSLAPFYGKKHTQNTKKKMRGPRPSIRGEKNPFYGKHHTKKTKTTLRNLYLGKTYEEIYGKERAEEIKETLSELWVGRTFSKSHRKNLSKAAVVLWQDEEYKKSRSGKNSSRYGKNANKGAGVGIQGYRKDIGIFVRSRWEANVCRIFNYLGINYIYEPKRFPLETLDKTYLPDFFLPDFKIYIEVKGYWSKEAKEKVDAFKKEYNPTLLIIDGFIYNSLKRTYKPHIKSWEGKEKPLEEFFSE